MPFKPGDPKPIGSGKQKGYVSAKTKALELLLEEHRYNPVNELLKLIPELDARDAAKVHLELMQYIYPKRKDQPTEDALDVTPEKSAVEALEYIKENFPQLLKASNE